MSLSKWWAKQTSDWVYVTDVSVPLIHNADREPVFGPDGNYYYRSDARGLYFIVPATGTSWTRVNPTSNAGRAILAKIPGLPRLTASQVSAVEQAAGRMAKAKQSAPFTPAPIVIVPQQASHPPKDADTPFRDNLLANLPARPLLLIGVPVAVIGAILLFNVLTRQPAPRSQVS